jgi:molecular chaperone IbpA
MRAQILTPLLRSTIGFDRFDRLLDAAARASEADRSYPPYNIEKTGEDDYRITMAVAGFAFADLDVTQAENVLVIRGKGAANGDGNATTGANSFLHRGIARRAFERRFELADTIKVVGANLELGLLHVDLVREIPEHRKPRKIEIGGGVTTIEQDRAA